MLEDRWLGLVLSLWMLGCAGMSGSFALYSPLIKAIGDYDQKQINALAAAKDLGESLGILPGLLCDVLPPWMLLLIGSSHFAIGFGLLWLVCYKLISTPTFLQMLAILLIASQGTAWFNTATLVTCVRNFPKSRGTVVGLLKSLVGLSSAIYTQMYFALLAPNQAGFLSLLAILPATVVLPSMAFLRPAHRHAGDDPDKESANLKYLMAACLGLALYLSIVNVVQEVIQLPEQVKLFTLGGLFLFLALPLLVPLSYWRQSKQASSEHQQKQQQATSEGSIMNDQLPQDEPSASKLPLLRTESVDSILLDLSPKANRFEPWYGEHQSDHLEGEGEQCADGSAEPESLTSPGGYQILSGHLPMVSSSAPQSDSCLHADDDHITLVRLRRKTRLQPRNLLLKRRSSKILLAVSEGAVRGSKRKGPRRGEDFTLYQAIWKADFWLLALGFLCGTGTALTAINNLAQMGIAQGYGNVRIFVSLISIWSFLGRLGGGHLSEELVRKFAIPRPIILLSAQLAMAVGHVCFAIAFDGSLYVGCVLIGLTYGVHWSVMPATVSELFGLLHFGMLFNVVAAFMSIGSFLFSSVIAGTLYDLETKKGINGPETSEAGILGHLVQNLGKSTSIECLGAHCFRTTFICMCVACLVGCLLNLVLVLRTRRVYKALYGNSSDAQVAA